MLTPPNNHCRGPILNKPFEKKQFHSYCLGREEGLWDGFLGGNLSQGIMMEVEALRD
jgi:hypothetical protein